MSRHFPTIFMPLLSALSQGNITCEMLASDRLSLLSFFSFGDFMGYMKGVIESCANLAMVCLLSAFLRVTQFLLGVC